MKFKDTFQPVRECGLSVEDGGKSIPLLLAYRDVREAARDWKCYSSDAPFRVPIPSEESVRRVRQLPIETDPPQHTTYRAVVEPLFRRAMQPDYIQRIDTLIAELLQPSGEVEIVRDFALPLQSRALACLLGMPLSEAEIWIGWGTHVFRDGDDSTAKGSVLDLYLRDQIKRARRDPDGDDFFAALARAKMEGRFLTDEEILGFANLTFAGGRDTLIHSIATVIAYFADHRDELVEIAKDSRRTNLAVEEFVRAISPLTHIGRVCKKSRTLGSQSLKAGQRVSLCWAAANYDPDVFDQPDTLKLDRMPNAHVGFGSGVHSCLGAPQARTILRALIRGLAAQTREMTILEVVPNLEHFGEHERAVGYKVLRAVIRN